MTWPVKSSIFLQFFAEFTVFIEIAFGTVRPDKICLLIAFFSNILIIDYDNYFYIMLGKS